jgi:hypothetical protein
LQLFHKYEPYNFCHLLYFMGVCTTIILECLEIRLKIMKILNSLLILISRGRFPYLLTYTGTTTAEDVSDSSFLSIRRRQQSNKIQKCNT